MSPETTALRAHLAETRPVCARARVGRGRIQESD